LRHPAIGMAVIVGLVVGPISGAAAGAAAAAAASAVTGLSVSPQPDTPDASPKTQLSFLGVAASRLKGLTVTGSKTGRHTGHFRSYSAQTGASFLPDRPFTPGETVSVHVVRPGFTAVTYSFTIARTRAVTLPPPAATRPAPDRPVSFVSRPDLKPPPVSVRTSSPAAAAGDIFIGPDRAPGQVRLRVGSPGPEILDETGSPVWFDPLSGGLAAYNFRPQTYEGQPVLTWWEGSVLSLGYGQGEDVIMNRSYHEIARVKAGNGYFADLHEFQLTPQDTALITIYSPVIADLSSVGGSRSALMVDSIVEEVDVKTGLVMFEWHALGHVSLTESHASPAGPYPFDFFHVNSIQLLPDQALLVSARNTWTVYKVSTRTGAVDWRLGGRASTFKLGAGAQFAWQHDARQQADGTISLFDDEAAPKQASQSRGLVLAVDPAARTASVAHQYTHPSPLLANSQGNMQLLGNGDEFTGWGASPYFTEFTPAGKVVFDAKLPSSTDTYRAFRASWSGQPTDQPAAAARTAGSHVEVYASWNGATDVAGWEVLGGTTATGLGPVGHAARTGFETAIDVSTPDRYFAVEAVDSTGKVLGRSRPAVVGGPSSAPAASPSPQDRALVADLKSGGTQPDYVVPVRAASRHPLRYAGGGGLIVALAAACGATYLFRRRRAG